MKEEKSEIGKNLRKKESNESVLFFELQRIFKIIFPQKYKFLSLSIN